MYLETVEIDNIRSIPSLSLDFTSAVETNKERRWSLLVGENGSGKSTVLKAIGLVLAGSDSLPHLIGDPGSWVRHGAEAGRIFAAFRTSDWERREVELVIHADDRPSSVITRNAERLAALDEALDHPQQNYFAVGYGPYRRLSGDPNFMSVKSRLPIRAQSLATLFDTDMPVHPIQSWAMTLDYRRGEEGLEIVRRSFEALMREVSFVGIDKEKETLLFGTPDGVVPLEALSDGYQNVAAWIGDLLYRVTEAFAHHENPLNARGILLIDEIDAHLHPSWQRRLREFLNAALPRFQIVATTHSALTLQQAHEGDAIVLARNGEGLVEATPFPGDPSKLRLHQIYDLGFRISSLDSWEIEKSKDVYRALSRKDRSELSDTEAQELETAQKTLEILPHDSREAGALGNEALKEFFDKLDATTSEIARQFSNE